jgi:Zn-finger nucleic acid-binding protein
MEVETIHGVSLDVCPNCGGIWFEGDELRSLMNSGPLSQDDLGHLGAADVSLSAQGRSTMLCPNDQSGLESYHYMYNSPIVLHTCPTCGGFWVAAGEVAKMETWRAQANTPLTEAQKSAEILAGAQIEHDNEMRKYQNYARFFGVLQRVQPGWLGLL